MSDTVYTPSGGQTVGPFFHFGMIYPDSHVLVSPDAPGAVTLHGTVTDGNGDPVPDALIEVWQPGPDGEAPASGAFTGFGRAATDANGEYRFVTLLPGTGPGGGAPFIAAAVFARGLLDRLFTRIYLPADAAATDPFLASLDAAERDTLIATADADGSLRFDIALQGASQTTFLTFEPAAVPRRG